MGALYYLALSLCLFSGFWAVVGASMTYWIFATIHLSCTMTILLLYWGESYLTGLAWTEDLETSASSNNPSL